MKQSTPYDAEKNAALIRESLFLKKESSISETLINTFNEAQQTSDFTKIVAQTINQHTDRFSIYFTHDIDWINPLHPYSLINYIRSLFVTHPWLSGQQLFKKDIFLETIEKILAIEKQENIQSVFHIGATNGKQLNRFGIRYNQTDKHYGKLVALLNSYSQNIGLHSSYHADEQHFIHQEKIQLEQFTGKQVLAHRSHFLHSHPQTLYPQLAASGIRYEFGNGLARQVGLKNNFPGKYKPIDHHSGQVMDVTVVPLILVDNVFFVKPYHEVLQSFKDTLHLVKQYNGSACILFHPENMILKPQLWNYFEEIIHICKNEGALVNTLL